MIEAEYIEVEAEHTKMGNAGQRYAVWCGQEILLESSRDPLHEAARALAVLGCGPDVIIILTFRAYPQFPMRARLGRVAGTRITEGAAYGPREVQWEPFNRDFSDED